MGSNPTSTARGSPLFDGWRHLPFAARGYLPGGTPAGFAQLPIESLLSRVSQQEITGRSLRPLFGRMYTRCFAAVTDEASAARANASGVVGASEVAKVISGQHGVSNLP